MAIKSIQNINQNSNSSFWILFTTIIGSSMAFIDNTVVNIALPVFQSQLGATAVDVQWIIEGYTLMLSALILIGGALGDSFGHHKVFTLGVVIFILTSIGCGLANQPKFLIFMRILQGLGGALLIPGSLAIITACFPESKRGGAIGTWSAFTSITMAIGPLLGGWLIDTFSWRWIFFINVPLGILVIFLLRYKVPATPITQPRKPDWLGGLLCLISLGSIIFALIHSMLVGWDDIIVLSLLAIGIITLGSFLWWENKTPTPMMPLKFFRSPLFSSINFLTLLLYGALGGALYFIPFVLMQLQGYSATQAGAVFLPLMLLIFLLGRFIGQLTDKIGPRKLLILGPLIASIGFFWLMFLNIHSSYWTVMFPAIFTLGIGMAIAVPALTTAIMNSLPINYVGLASGINNAIARIGGLLAIALFGILLYQIFSHHLQQSIDQLNLPSNIRNYLDNEKIRLAAMSIPTTLSDSLKLTLANSIKQAFLTGFHRIVFIAAILSILSSLVIWITGPLCKKTKISF
ncbi:MAG: MFS transporter [Pseudomonadota bacterium]